MKQKFHIFVFHVWDVTKKLDIVSVFKVPGSRLFGRGRDPVIQLVADAVVGSLSPPQQF